MEVAGPLGTPLGLAQRKRASPRGKESACNAGDPGLIPGLGRSPEEEKGYPLQYSGLENSMDCTVLGVKKSQTQLSKEIKNVVIGSKLGLLRKGVGV